MSEITHAAPSGVEHAKLFYLRGQMTMHIDVQCKPTGGARRDRTDDLMLAKHALSQLSYGPIGVRRFASARPMLCWPQAPAIASAILAAAPSGATPVRALVWSRVSECFRLQKAQPKWWAWEDLNFRPHAYQARALTN